MTCDHMIAQTGEDTQHQDLREPLDAEAFAAFPSALTSAAHLRKKMQHEFWGLGQRRCGAPHRALLAVQLVFFGEQPQTVFKRHLAFALL